MGRCGTAETIKTPGQVELPEEETSLAGTRTPAVPAGVGSIPDKRG